MIEFKNIASTLVPSLIGDRQKKISVLIYLVLATTCIAIGTYTLFENPFVCLPIHFVYRDNYFLYYLDITQGMLHLFMDLSATYLLIGLRLFFSAVYYEKSHYFDYLVFTFFLVSMITHWVESFNEDRNVNNPIYSLIPMLMIGSVMLLKRIKPTN